MTHSSPPPASRQAPRRLAKQELGARGESIAAEFLERHGHLVLDRNWRAPHGRGELDLVTLDRGKIIVIEVKTRSSLDYGHPFEAIGAQKLERLHRLGWEWCASHGRPGTLGRVDAVAVLLPAEGPAVIEHLEGVR